MVPNPSSKKWLANVPNSVASPLAGKRIVVTRAVQQTSDLFARLSAAGAIPVSLPLVSFAPPQDYAALDAALDQLQSFDWIIFTSANAVDAVATRAHTRQLVILRASDEDARRASTAPSSPKLPEATPSVNRVPQIAAVGPATKAAATAAGFPVDYTAKTHLGTALAGELSEPLRNKSVFLPRSDRANPDLPKALRALNAKVTEVIAYRTLPPSDTDRQRATQTLAQNADAVLFFSPSAVQNLTDLLGRDAFVALHHKIAIAAIGPITARALREAGVERFVQAVDTTSAAVIEVLRSHFAAAPSQSQFIAGANPR